jgi:hypothetical protein
VTRKRLELTDVHPDPNSGRRLARLLKNTAIYGFRAGPVMPLADNPESPQALAEERVIVLDAGSWWEVWWMTPTGSRIYCLEMVYLAADLAPRRAAWVEVVARLLEHGGRLYRSGEMEIPSK